MSGLGHKQTKWPIVSTSASEGKADIVEELSLARHDVSGRSAEGLTQLSRHGAAQGNVGPRGTKLPEMLSCSFRGPRVDPNRRSGPIYERPIRFSISFDHARLGSLAGSRFFLAVTEGI